MPGHGLQFNTGAGGQMYAPARDLAYNYPQMISSCVRCFNRDFWPELMEQLEKLDSDTGKELMEDLESAQLAQIEFMRIACENPDEDVKDVLERCGWAALPPRAQIGWAAMMGQVILGQLFVGLRDVTPGGSNIRAPLRRLLDGLAEARRAVNNIDSDQERGRVLTQLRTAVQTARDCGISEGKIENVVASALQDPEL